MIESDFYKKDTMFNENYVSLFNKEIIEYDLKEAGLNITRAFSFLPQEKIDKIMRKDKDARKVLLGIEQRDNETYKENMKKGFIQSRMMFFDANDIQDQDVLCIKKDAIFMLKECNATKFGKYLDFRIKNRYTSFILLKKNIEFYYSNLEDACSLKGIDSEKVSLHQPYMISFLINFCKKIETSPKEEVYEYISRMIDRYKSKDLDIGYYRELNQLSEFVLLDESDPNLSNKDMLDISYNYYNVFMKLIKMII